MQISLSDVKVVREQKGLLLLEKPLHVLLDVVLWRGCLGQRFDAMHDEQLAEQDLALLGAIGDSFCGLGLQHIEACLSSSTDGRWLCEAIDIVLGLPQNLAMA